MMRGTTGLILALTLSACGARIVPPAANGTVRPASKPVPAVPVKPADVAAALQREPGQPLYSLSAQLGSLLHSTQSLSLQRLQWLQQAYDLTEFDIDVIIIALAPEIDLRYERLYAYLQTTSPSENPALT